MTTSKKCKTCNQHIKASRKRKVSKLLDPRSPWRYEVWHQLPGDADLKFVCYVPNRAVYELARDAVMELPADRRPIHTELRSRY